MCVSLFLEFLNTTNWLCITSGCYDWHSSVHGHWLLAKVGKPNWKTWNYIVLNIFSLHWYFNFKLLILYTYLYPLIELVHSKPLPYCITRQLNVTCIIESNSFVRLEIYTETLSWAETSRACSRSSSWLTAWPSNRNTSRYLLYRYARIAASWD